MSSNCKARPKLDLFFFSVTQSLSKWRLSSLQPYITIENVSIWHFCTKTYPLTRSTSFGYSRWSRSRCISETVETKDCMSTTYLVCKWHTAALVFSNASGWEPRFFCFFNKETFLWYSSFIISLAWPTWCHNRSIPKSFSYRNMVSALNYRQKRKYSFSLTKKNNNSYCWKYILYIWRSSKSHSNLTKRSMERIT